MLSLPPVFYILLNNLLKQKQFIKTHLEKELYPYKLKNDGSLTPADFKKILSYYSLGVPVILGESLCVLRGKKMHPRERLSMTFLGGISGLLDDLFDDPEKEVDHLENFILQPEKLLPSNSHERLLVHLYELGLHYSYNSALIQQQALRVFQSQKESLKQKESNVNSLKIEEITYAKGGNSFLYYRLCLYHPLEMTEQNFLYELGGIMQLGNDIFDVWEDHQNGINTAATLCKDVRELRNTFRKRLQKCFSLAYNTPYPEQNIQQFLRICSLALARVFVCLEQFLDLQKSTGNQFKIEKYTRKQLICDMQKPMNQIKAFKFFLETGTNKNSFIT